MGDLWDSICEMVTEPFVGNIDITQLFFLVGLVLVFIALWGFILYHMKAAGAAVIEAV